MRSMGVTVTDSTYQQIPCVLRVFVLYLDSAQLYFVFHNTMPNIWCAVLTKLFWNRTYWTQVPQG